MTYFKMLLIFIEGYGSLFSWLTRESSTERRLPWPHVKYIFILACSSDNCINILTNKINWIVSKICKIWKIVFQQDFRWILDY